MTTKPTTPLMQQYFAIKEQYPDTLLLFQVGDFYELFFDDAKQASSFLAIALTARGKVGGEPIPLCGVPLHAIDHYIAKLVRGGFKVALCNQLEPATPGKVVERGVVQVYTPGTLTDSALLDDKQPSYLLSFFPMHNAWGLLFGELLTAQLFATVLPHEAHKVLESELTRFLPDEILVPPTQEGVAFQRFFTQQGYPVAGAQYYQENASEVRQWLQAQFKPSAVQSVSKQPSLFQAFGNFYGYLKKNQVGALDQFKHLHLYAPEEFLMLDTATQRNLELVRNTHDNSRNNTLFSVMDKAVTAMGSRTIRKWIMRPLVNKDLITARQDAVSHFMHEVTTTQSVKKQLQQLGDIERTIGRISLCRGTVNDYKALLRAMAIVPTIKEDLAHIPIQIITIIVQQLGDTSRLKALLEAALHDDDAKDWIIKGGFNQRLDEVRRLVEDSRSLLIELEQAEQKRTGINSLKIRYNNVHGYYFEVTKTHAHAIPDDYQRVQSLVGKERFMTPELKQLQADIMTANSEISALEKSLFDQLKREVAVYAGSLRKMAHALAHLDGLLGLAQTAYEYGYIRPTFNEENRIAIKQGCHPVVQQHIGGAFIANDLLLDDAQSLLIITGPNMGGKSTYLRQAALITLMAQTGSFVPAESADIALRDRIFTRIGASDNVTDGKSTFLVEMEETASICRYATANSLIILDEVGRGTSTYDGIAIAQAVIEYICTDIQARCLFATHYHELTELDQKLPMIKPLYAASKQTKDGIVFLHKLIDGTAEGSFGIHVAQLADLPEAIVLRAQELLDDLHLHQSIVPAQLDTSDNASIMHTKLKRVQQELDQARALNQELKEKAAAFDDIDYDELSPKKAFDLLWQLKGM